MSEHVLSVLLVVNGALFAALSTAGVMFARYIARRLGGMAVTPDQLAALDKWITAAVSYVEERVHQYLRGLLANTPAPLTPTDKRKIAVKVARELAPDNLQGFSDEALAKLVDAKVQERRASGFPPPSSLVPPSGSTSLPTPSFPPPPRPMR